MFSTSAVVASRLSCSCMFVICQHHKHRASSLPACLSLLSHYHPETWTTSPCVSLKLTTLYLGHPGSSLPLHFTHLFFFFAFFKYNLYYMIYIRNLAPIFYGCNDTVCHNTSLITILWSRHRYFQENCDVKIEL